MICFSGIFWCSYPWSIVVEISQKYAKEDDIILCFKLLKLEVQPLVGLSDLIYYHHIQLTA